MAGAIEALHSETKVLDTSRVSMVANPNPSPLMLVLLTASNGQSPNSLIMPGFSRHTPSSSKSRDKGSLLVVYVVAITQCSLNRSVTRASALFGIKQLITIIQVPIADSFDCVDHCCGCYRCAGKLIKFPTAFFNLPFVCCHGARLKCIKCIDPV